MCEKIHHLIKEKTNKVDRHVNKRPVAGVKEIRELLCVAGHLYCSRIHVSCVFSTLGDVVRCLLSVLFLTWELDKPCKLAVDILLVC